MRLNMYVFSIFSQLFLFLTNASSLVQTVGEKAEVKPGIIWGQHKYFVQYVWQHFFKVQASARSKMLPGSQAQKITLGAPWIFEYVWGSGKRSLV